MCKLGSPSGYGIAVQRMAAATRGLSRGMLSPALSVPQAVIGQPVVALPLPPPTSYIPPSSPETGRCSHAVAGVHEHVHRH